MENYFTSGNYKFHYVIIGEGKEPMLAFHGFYRDCEDFRKFESSVGKKYCIYSFDLLEHGKTESSEVENIFSEEDLKHFFTSFCNSIGIDKVSLLGYSLGGKLALSLIEFFPQKIKDVLLFAPYGVKRNLFISIVEKFRLSEKIFQSLIKNPNPFFKIIRFLYSVRIINERMFDFLEHQFESEERRGKLFNVWKVYKKIIPDIFIIRKKINTYRINLKLYYGIFDPIEPPSCGKFFAEGLIDKKCLKIVPLNHNLVCEKMNEILLNEFN